MWDLLRQRNFTLVWTGGLITLTGNFMLMVGLPLFIYDQTGSTLATGAMFLIRLLPRVLLGSVAGVFVDRWDRRRTLVIANLLLALALLPVLTGVLVDALWIVYAAAFVTSVLEQVVTPAEDALLPRLVARDQLVAANALNELNNNIARLAGPPLGGLLLQVTGFGGVLVIDAVSFGGAALCFALLRVDARPVRDAQAGGATQRARVAAVSKEWIAGLALVRRSRPAAVILLFMALTGAGEGIMATLFVPWVRTVLAAGSFSYGLIVGAQAVGGIAGGILVARYGGRLRPVLMWGVGALGLVLFDTATFTYPYLLPGIVPALVFMAIVGLPIAGLRVGMATIRQTAVDDAFRGRLMGAVVAVSSVTTALGAAVAGVLGSRVDLTVLLLADVACYALAGVLVLILLRGYAAPVSGHAPEFEISAAPG